MGPRSDSENESKSKRKKKKKERKSSRHRDRDRSDRSRKKRGDGKKRSHRSERNERSERFEKRYFSPNPVRHSERSERRMNHRKNDRIFGMEREALHRFDDLDGFEENMHFDYGLSDAHNVRLDNAQSEECNNELKALL